MSTLPESQRASAVGTSSQKANVAAGANLRPEIVLVLAQANTSSTATQDVPFEVFENSDYGAQYGYGSPFALALDSIYTAEKAVQVYGLPVGDPTTGGVAAESAVTAVAGTTTKAFNLHVIAKGIDTVVGIAKGIDENAVAALIEAGIDSQIRYPFSAATVDNVTTLTCTFQGTYGNEINIRIEDDNGNAIDAATYGVAVGVTPFTGGVGVTDISTAIENITENLKVTRIVNQFTDTSALDLVQTLGDDKRDPNIGEILCSYSGQSVDTSTASTVNADYTALVGFSAARKLDKVNFNIPAGTEGLPIELTAELVARIVARYQVNPGKPPRGIQMQNAVNRPKSIQWFGVLQRNNMYIGGVSNFEYDNGVYQIMDLCNMYNPADDTKLNASQPIDKDDEDLTGTGNMLYDLRKTFQSDKWKAVKFLAELDISSNDAARKLSDVRVDVDNRIDVYVDALFLKDAIYAKENKTVKFAGTNPERVNVQITGKSATTGRIYDLNLNLFKAS